MENSVSVCKEQNNQARDRDKTDTLLQKLNVEKTLRGQSFDPYKKQFCQFKYIILKQSKELQALLKEPLFLA